MNKILGLMVATVLLTGCAGGMSPVGYAFITNVEGPITATTNTVGSKRGETCAINILGLIGTGDASIATAKRNGNITKLATADYSSNGIYPIFGRTCTYVTGE